MKLRDENWDSDSHYFYYCYYIYILTSNKNEKTWETQTREMRQRTGMGGTLQTKMTEECSAWKIKKAEEDFAQEIELKRTWETRRDERCWRS